MTDKKRIILSLEDELVEAIENYRHRKRIQFTSKACEDLIKRGLAAMDEQVPPIDRHAILERVKEIERLLKETESTG